MRELDQLMDETAEHYESKMSMMYETIQQLKNRCITLQKANRHLKKVNGELVREKRQGQGQRYNNNKSRGKR